MVILLVACMLIAPFIRNFKGLFDYLLAVWAFLSPGVFVTVIFGLFYKKSTERAAYWTLVIGVVLGFFSFCLLNLPLLSGIKEHLPYILQNKLNLSPWVTIVCAANMYLMSNYGKRTEKDLTNAQTVAIDSISLTMTPDESRNYTRFLIGLACFVIAVIAFFSPLVF